MDRFEKMVPELQTLICSYLTPVENARMVRVFRIKLFPATPAAYFQMVYEELATTPDWAELVAADGEFMPKFKSLERFADVKSEIALDYMALYELICQRQFKVNTTVVGEYIKPEHSYIETELKKIYKSASVKDRMVIAAQKTEHVKLPITKMIINERSGDPSEAFKVMSNLGIETLEVKTFGLAKPIEIPAFVRNLEVETVEDVKINHRLDRLKIRNYEINRELDSSYMCNVENLTLDIVDPGAMGWIGKDSINFRSLFKNTTLKTLEISHTGTIRNYYFGKVPESLTTLIIRAPVKYMMIGRNCIENLTLVKNHKCPKLGLFPRLKCLTIDRIRADYVIPGCSPNTYNRGVRGQSPPDVDELIITGWDTKNVLPKINCQVLVSHGPIKIKKSDLRESNIRSVSAFSFQVV